KRIPRIEAKIGELSEEVKVIVRAALEAYLKKDVEQARKTADSDAIINALAAEIFDDCIEEMKVDAELVLGGTDYLLVSRYLERIGDYVTNICEWVIYLETGKITELNSNHTL